MKDVTDFLQTFQSHCDAAGASRHAAGRLGLGGVPSQHSLDVAHTVTVDGVCRKAKTRRRVDFCDVNLKQKKEM